MDREEFERWFRASRRTSESARADLDAGFYDWACFKAQQSAEMALKALLWGCGKPRAGHSLIGLLRFIGGDLGIEAPSDIREASARLSRYYTITRYPNTWASGIPSEYITRREAIEALRYADKIVGWVEEIWRRLSERERRGEGER